MKTVIIKLGGAAITNKKGNCQLVDDSALDSLILQIQQAYTFLAASGHRLVLIHGAGSFGHPQAKRFNLKQGWIASSGLSTPPHNTNETDEDYDYRDQKAGFAHTRKCLLELHLALLSRLQRRGLPVLGLSPFDHVETDGGDKSADECFQGLASRATQLLKLGFIPLLHGDAVLDRSLGCTILSGDIVMHKLAMLLPNVSRCVFVTDVEGIYDADPKIAKKKAKLIKHVPIDPLGDKEEKLSKHVRSNKRQRRLNPIASKAVSSNGGVVDVTGGMQGKIKWARQMVLDAAAHQQRNDLEVVICKAASQEATRVMSLEPVLERGLPIPGQLMTVISIAQTDL